MWGPAPGGSWCAEAQLSARSSNHISTCAHLTQLLFVCQRVDAVHRTAPTASEPSAVADSSPKIAKAGERLRKAEGDVERARQALRKLMRDELAAGRTTKSAIARALGVSRQRVQKMLEE